HDQSVVGRIAARMRAAAAAVDGANAEPLRPAGKHVLVGTITTTLDLKGAKKATKTLRGKLGTVEGATLYLTGSGALQADLDPIFQEDLKVGEFLFAIPIALVILLVVFGVSLAVLIPFLFAFATINGTLGIVFVIAHRMDMASYVTNLVQLIGLAISIDYSLLIVYRFREELEEDGQED